MFVFFAYYKLKSRKNFINNNFNNKFSNYNLQLK